MRQPIVTGFRGRALLILGTLDVIVAATLIMAALKGPGTGSTGFIARTLPPYLLAVIWGIVALLCFVCAFRQRDSLAWSVAIGVKVFWGLLSITGWLTGEIPQGYLSAGIWWAFASLVWLISRWPEPTLPREFSNRSTPGDC